MYICVEFDGKLDPMELAEKVSDYGVTIAKIENKVFMYGDRFNATEIADIVAISGDYYYYSMNIDQDRGWRE